MKIKIGTRGSKLALWQARHVAENLNTAGLETEIVPIETKGDKMLDVSIAQIGSEGVFTEAIEAQLASDQIDIAVHSAKDMPSILPPAFKLIAFLEREKANDVVISKQQSLKLTPEANFVLGTSSTRRVATLKYFYPNIQTIPVRGNLQTRIQKMEQGTCDALLLAFAGVYRMGYEEMICQVLPLSSFTPAVGQGSIAIEVHESLPAEKTTLIRKSLNHKPTEICLLAERSYLKAVEGGCSIPVFALARIDKAALHIAGGIVSLDGKERISRKLSGGLEDAEKLGEQLAEEVLSLGGNKILKDIRTLSKI